MRFHSEDSHCSGIAPMLFIEDDYIGQYKEFFDAREADTGSSFILIVACTLRVLLYD